MLPGEPELLNPRQAGIVCSKGTEQVGMTGAGSGGRESVGLGDNVVGQNAAVAPSSHTQLLGSDETTFDQVVDTGHDILKVFVPPVSGHNNLLTWVHIPFINPS